MQRTGLKSERRVGGGGGVWQKAEVSDSGCWGEQGERP